jgi:hypothetical protein
MPPKPKRPASLPANANDAERVVYALALVKFDEGMRAFYRAWGQVGGCKKAYNRKIHHSRITEKERRARRKKSGRDRNSIWLTYGKKVVK